MISIGSFYQVPSAKGSELISLNMLDRLHLAMNARVNDPMMANASNISAITAYALEGNREWCIEADMNDYIAKPLQKGELDEVLQEVWPKGSVKLGTPNVFADSILTPLYKEKPIRF